MKEKKQNFSSSGFWRTIVLIIILISIFLTPSLKKVGSSLALFDFKFKPQFSFDLKKQVAKITDHLDITNDTLFSREFTVFASERSQSKSIFNFFHSGSLPKETNFLILGIPGKDHPASDLTDSIAFLHINKEKNKAVAVSIPRDFLIKIPGKDSYTKINTLYSMEKSQHPEEENGLRLIGGAVNKITGVNLDGFLVIDLTGFQKIVDSLGGIKIYMEEDIYDPRFPTPDGGYETFSLKKGWHYLDGNVVVKYVRTRHTPRGDFDRIKRQQKVIGAIRDKIGGLNILFDFPKILSIFSAIHQNIQTDFNFNDIKYFLELNKEIKDEDIQFYSLDTGPGGLLKSSSMILGGERAYILLPKAGLEDYSEIQEFIKGVIYEN